MDHARKPDPPDLPPDEAALVLSRAYAWLAGEEALFRALLAERNLDPEKARFWIGVYERLKADTEG
jgi:hypothetical protein